MFNFFCGMMLVLADAYFYHRRVKISRRAINCQVIFQANVTFFDIIALTAQNKYFIQLKYC